MTLWEKFSADGVDYDLAHANDFTLEVPSKDVEGKVYRVRVTYSCHIFTKEWQDGVHPENLKFVAGKEVRCFCKDRHVLSLLLKRIIEGAVGWKAYFSNKGNFMLIEDIDGSPAPYVIYFDILKASNNPNHDLVMQVRSAHPKPEIPEMVAPITFKRLVEASYLSNQLTRPRSVLRKKKVPLKLG